MRWSDSLWHLSLRTLRRCGDMPFLRWTHIIYSSSHKGWTCWTRLNAPGNGAPRVVTEINFGLHSICVAPSRWRHTRVVTEINFGLHSAESVRLARHGRPGQGSTDLGTAINACATKMRMERCRTPSSALWRIIAVLTKVEPDGQGWTLLGMARPARWPK